MIKAGIDAIAFYVPELYVDIKDLALARSIAPEKLQKGLGLQKMAIPDVGEDAATFAAQALIELIRKNQVNPKDIGRIYLGTESAVDGSKPTATYAVEMAEDHLEADFGTRAFKNCDVLDMTFACVGAVDALHNCLDWVRQNPNEQAIVIASDVSKYDLNSTGEYTQGAGAVAVLIKTDPDILIINDTWGVANKSEGDFFKPRRIYDKNELLKTVLEAFDIKPSQKQLKEFLEQTKSSFWNDQSQVVSVYKEEPVFDGQFSNNCYNDRITEALEQFKAKSSINFLKDWDHLIFHLPYAFHGRRIIFNNWLKWTKAHNLQALENEIGRFEDTVNYTKSAYKSHLFSSFIKHKVAAGEIASSEIGNMYTASIFMALLSLLSFSLDKEKDLSGSQIGFIAYGSGSKSKVFSGIVQPFWHEKIAGIGLFKKLKERTPISVEVYEDLHKLQRTDSVKQPNYFLSHMETGAANYGLRKYQSKS